jgi:hydroxymethylpyrimidine pyrophosphatase-like HAD family hydrolase
MSKRVVVDLDGTILQERPTFERSLTVPMLHAVESLQQLSAKGYHITVYTARSWAEYDMTLAQLHMFRIPFDLLLCGKPIADVWIDDRAMRFTTWKDVMEWM